MKTRLEIAACVMLVLGFAVPAGAQSEVPLNRVRERAAKASGANVARTERRLTTAAVKVNAQAFAEEDQVAARLAHELGLATGVLVEQKNRIRATWGDLMIAHTLRSNAGIEITIDQLFMLHDEGQDWSHIASGLGLSLNELVAAVNGETRVAVGLAPGDGKVAVVHGTGASGAGDASAKQRVRN